MNKGYICPQCKTSYAPLEADKLMDFSRNALICEICHAEVVDNENAETVQGSQDRMQRFNHQMRFIREGLQKSEAMILPAYVLPNSYSLELPLIAILTLGLMSLLGLKTTLASQTNKKRLSQVQA